jgi:hypothetical protein
MFSEPHWHFCEVNHGLHVYIQTMVGRFLCLQRTERVTGYSGGMGILFILCLVGGGNVAWLVKWVTWHGR